MGCLKYLLISAALLLLTCAPGRDQGAGFQYTLTIAPGNYLFIYGHEFHGDVVCALEPGDSVRIAGLPVYPRRPSEPAVFSEEDLRDLYGEVPFVQERVKEGQSWHQAADAYAQRRAAMYRSASRVFSREVRRSGSRELAVKAALDSLDWSLVDPSVQPEVTGTMIGVKLRGLSVQHLIELSQAPRAARSVAAAKQPQKATPAKAREIVARLSKTVGPGGRGPSMHFLTHGGETILAGQSVSKALKQIADAGKADSTASPLSYKEIRRIRLQGMLAGPVGPAEMEEILAARRGSTK